MASGPVKSLQGVPRPGRGGGPRRGADFQQASRAAMRAARPRLKARAWGLGGPGGVAGRPGAERGPCCPLAPPKPAGCSAWCAWRAHSAGTLGREPDACPVEQPGTNAQMRRFNTHYLLTGDRLIHSSLGPEAKPIAGGSDHPLPVRSPRLPGPEALEGPKALWTCVWMGRPQFRRASVSSPQESPAAGSWPRARGWAGFLGAHDLVTRRLQLV